MKMLLKILLPACAIGLISMAVTFNKTTEESAISSSDETFLRRAADARMMDWAEGELASERGTTEAIKAYGKLMITDQDNFMAEIKSLAKSKGVVLPEALSETKADGLDDLRSVTGKKFDKKFLKMIIKDHKRDVKEFRRASKSEDKDVSTFALRHLPMLQEHLEKAQALKDKL